MSITLAELTRNVKHLNNIKKHGIDIEIVMTVYWDNNVHQYHIVPKFVNLQTIAQVASICETNNSFITLNDNLKDANDVIVDLFDTPNCEALLTKHQTLVNSSVKYYAEEVFRTRLRNLKMVYLTQAPFENVIGDHTYRTIVGDIGVFGLRKNFIFSVSEQHRLYNFLDRGHILVFHTSEKQEENYTLVTNQLGLDANYSLASFSLAPEIVETIATNGVFLNNRNSRIDALRLERALPEKYKPEFNAVKDLIFKNYEKNAQNVIITKFQRSEIAAVEVNNIKFTPTSATYETISIEADNLSEIVLPRLDTNSEFDIYSVIQIYVDTIVEEITKTKTNDFHTGFTENRSWRFTINQIPIEIAISTANTRRKINGVTINNAEVSRIVRRASCFTNAAEYNTFVKSVATLTLEVRDILANGLPVKVHIFERDDLYRPPTLRHPRLFFIREKGKFKIYLDRQKLTTANIKKFVGFIRKVQRVNTQTNGYGMYELDTDGRRSWTTKDQNWARRELKRVVHEFAKHENGDNLTTKELGDLIEETLLERTEAEKKSLQLLASVVKEVGAELTTFKGVEGYKVSGGKRTYFVEKATNKVYNHANGAYVCIVDGRHEMGAGYDSLVARLLSLKNDSLTAKYIHTI